MSKFTKHYAAATAAQGKQLKMGQIARCRNHGPRSASWIDDDNRSTPAPRAEIVKVTASGRMTLREEDGNEFNVRPDGEIEGRLIWTGSADRHYGMQDSTGYAVWELWTFPTEADIAAHDAYTAKLEQDRADRAAKHAEDVKFLTAVAEPRYEALKELAERMGMKVGRASMGGASLSEHDREHVEIDEFVRVSEFQSRGATMATASVSMSIDTFLSLAGVIDPSWPS